MIVPALLAREIIWLQESELISIYLALDLVTNATKDISSEIEIVDNWTATDPLILQLGLALRSQMQQGDLERLNVEIAAQLPMVKAPVLMIEMLPLKPYTGLASCLPSLEARFLKKILVPG